MPGSYPGTKSLSAFVYTTTADKFPVGIDQQGFPLTNKDLLQKYVLANSTTNSAGGSAGGINFQISFNHVSTPSTKCLGVGVQSSLSSQITATAVMESVFISGSRKCILCLCVTIYSSLTQILYVFLHISSLCLSYT